MDQSFDCWLQNRVDLLKNKGLYRTLHTMNSSPGPEVNVNGENKIVFSSNNYLGLANDNRVKNAASQVAHEFGVGSSGSRLTTGNTKWHARLEERIAQFKQTEAALLFSNGYLANIGVLSSLPEEGDVILSDAFNHASIIDGCRLSKARTIVYKHVDLIDLEQKLMETQKADRRFIVTDGVFSMDGDIAPLDSIMQLAKKYSAYVIVDDAHGTGILGEFGRGTCEYLQVKPDVMIGTLSKAVGTEGGFVAGSKELIDFLINQSRTFIFQTSLPPSVCAASCQSLEVIVQGKQLRNALVTNIWAVTEGLTKIGYRMKGTNTPIIPLIIGDSYKAVKFSQMLHEKGIFAPAIRPPTVPKGESRIRITVTAEHTIEEINQLVDACELIGNELSVIR
ncbi:8-amino-7-oxononanoate synthase [Jeotgalibacillus marinus]|uniref:8-amino-7-ketopelargonate synthase n=1 Tax=Jeotgalibacillus marinus TaxID=86667 RepID=A0ABV3Q341_9BACL